MAGKYAVYYGLSTATFGWIDLQTLNLGSYFAGSSAGFQTLFGTAIHAVMATWAMDNFGLPLGAGSGSTRYVVLPLAAGAANALIGQQLANFIGAYDNGNAYLGAFLTEGVAAGLGCYVFTRAV